MSQANDYVIDTQALCKTYKEVEALKPLNLKVPKNSIFGFLGPNGAGKTTTIKLLLGLTRPTSGSGTIFGHDIVREGISIRRRIGYLPQDPRFYEHMTARETLDFTARFFFEGPNDEIAKRVSETLELVGIDDKADRPIKTFSGGERQRLGIAQAQVNYPDILILDEPAASLDPLGRRDVLEVMERLRKYATVFYCTHILDDVQRVSDRVAILNHGELVSQGSIEELLAGAEGVAFQVKLRGQIDAVRQKISAEDWVSTIQENPTHTGYSWIINVKDAEQAEAQLFRLLASDPGIIVTEFRRKTYELEDVFMQIVEGGQRVRQ
ncbi:MAG: ABC transporter ATP-binding protein [Anaerolineales bacterium]|nr:MAG: ABC transporter ATP-binding protein [Anaerolineales bacterium]